MSYNNKFFICFTVLGKDKNQIDNKSIPSCYINDYETNQLNEINCTYNTEYGDGYKVLYFNETGDFMLVSVHHLTTTLLSSFNNYVEKCKENIFSKQSLQYYLIYNNGKYKEINKKKFEEKNWNKNILIIKEISVQATNIEQILTTNIPIIKTSIIMPKPNITYIFENTTKSKEEVFNNISNILEDKKVGVTYEIKGDNFSIIIKPTNSTPLPNTTYVEFDECEKEIRSIYNISNTSIITFLQIEINNDNNDALYNQIKYFIYDEEMRELNLSLCEDINTQIHYSIKDNNKLDITSISNFQEKGIDIFNLKDKFFTDLCYSYSDSNNDMTLEDRIKYLYQNYTLCEIGCTYNNIDIINMNIICNCKIQGNENTSSINMKSLFYQQPKDTGFFDSNIGVIKCYKLVFSLNNKLNNIGFLCFAFLFILYIIFNICLCAQGIKPVRDYLFNEMLKNGYISNKNNNSIKLAQNGRKNKSKKKKHNRTQKSILTTKNYKNKNRNLTKNIQNNNIIITGINIDKNNNNKNSLMSLNSTHMKRKKTKLNKLNNINKNMDNNLNNFGIIKINLNDYKNYFPQESNQSLHNYTFDEAIKYDKRNILRVAYIYLLSKQIIFKTIFQRSPLELFPIRFILFIFMFSCDLALNALFYFNDNISQKYHYAKSIFLFAFTNNITIIIYSTLLSYFLITLLSKLSNSSSAIRNVFESVEKKIKFKPNYKINEKMKKNVNTKIEKILRCFKCKIIFLFIIITILILAFGYFVTAFCHVFSSTQTSWLLDTFLSILSRLIIELFFAFFFGKLYQISVRSNFKTLYKIVMFFYDFS